MTRLLFLSVLAFTTHAACPSLGEAQTRPEVPRGSVRTLDDLKVGVKLRVVVLASDLERLQGRLRGVDGTGMVLEIDGSRRRELSMSSILRVDEAYRDRKRGAFAGVLTGAVGVYAWDFFGPHPRYADQSKRYKENVAALVAATTIGALIGGVVGWHRWRSVYTATR